MTNEQLIEKMKEDMKMRNFSKNTYDSYLGKAKDIMRYYGKKPFFRLFSAPSCKLSRLGRSLFSLKAHCTRVEKKTLSAVFAKAAF